MHRRIGASATRSRPWPWDQNLLKLSKRVKMCQIKVGAINF